jgi:plastocyanin
VLTRYAKPSAVAPAVAAYLIAIACFPAAAAEGLRLSLTDASGAAAPGVVLYLQGGVAEAAREGGSHAVMDQRNKAFVPEYLVVQKGTAVDFPNSDTVRHHVYSFSQPNEFEMPLYKGAPARPVLFQHAGIVAVGCNIHDQMLGYIVVVETPYFGITGADGSLLLAAVRPGRYQVMAWSPRLEPNSIREVGAVDVASAGDAAVVRLRLAQKLKAAPARNSSLSWDAY